MAKMTAAQRAAIDARDKAARDKRNAEIAAYNKRAKATNAKHSAGYKKPVTPKKPVAKATPKPKPKAKPKKGIVNTGKTNIRKAYLRSGDYSGT